MIVASIMRNGFHPSLVQGLFRTRLASPRGVVALMLVCLNAILLGQGAVPDPSASGAPAPGPIAVPAARQASNIAIITIEGEINETTAKSVVRRIQLAQRAGAGAIVFELNTPGGEVPAVLKITNAIKNCPIKNTVSWVNTQAYSGGAIIAVATREMVVASRVQMGDAIPIQIDPVRGLNPRIGAAERQKILSPLIADLTESARLNGYDEKLMQGLVSLGVELWLIENPSTGERLFIGREEHEMLFGPPPPGEMPRVAGASLGSTPAKPGDASTDSNASDAGSQRKDRNKPDPKPRTPGAEQPIDDSNRVIPASPELKAAADEASRDNSLSLPKRTRPTLAPGDKGKWVKVEKASDGLGALVFSAEDLLHYRMARQTVTNDEELRQFFGAKNLIRLDQSWSEVLVGYLTHWLVRMVILAIFLMAIFVSMTHPGLVLPETVAVVALAAMIAPPLLINMANWWEVAAILVGLLLIVAELVIFPGFGVPGVLGLILFFGGIVGTFVPGGGVFPDTPEQREDLAYGMAAVLVAVGSSGFGIYMLSKHFGSLPLLNRLVLKEGIFDQQEAGPEDLLSAMKHDVASIRIGERGVTISPLRPTGKVEIAGELHEAVAGLGYIEAGQRVRVTKVSAFQLTVERDAGAPPTPEASA